jgi:putative DNA modification/repair radical SAM protein
LHFAFHSPYAFRVELSTKLEILADAAKYDASCASSGSVRKAAPGGLGNSTGVGICHSYTPDGRCVSLLKILLTNYCVYDCVFCVNRVSSDTRRARFTPEEIISLTIDFYQRNYIEGLFLSSGIIQSPDYTMEQLVAVARGLRHIHNFNGYIHLKTIPGASPELIRQAGALADRLSANVELPTQSDLTKLAPEKNLVTIRSAMSNIKSGVDQSIAEQKDARRIISSPAAATARVRRAIPNASGFSRGARDASIEKFAPAGQSTQMVVGATETNDTQILSLASDLYSTHHLRRIYYSAFSPFPKADTRLPIQAPPLVREHRLYEADWLMRYYGFSAHELTTPAQPNLDLKIDPKLNWALRHRELFPLDINTASREMLLRIPGIGYRTVQRILSIRRYHRLRLDDLKKLRVYVQRAKSFILTDDHNPAAHAIDAPALAHQLIVPATQLGLFAPEISAVSGQL